MIKFIVKIREFAGKLLGAGEHVVTVESIAETVSKASDNWDDQTPQLEVKFRNDEGTLTHWFQLKGFKTRKDYPNGKAPKGIEFRSSENGNEEYAVDTKSNERIESDDKTETCMTILGEFAGACGLSEGKEITQKALEGAEVGIGVRLRADNKVEYHYSKLADDVKVSQDAD